MKRFLLVVSAIFLLVMCGVAFAAEYTITVTHIVDDC